MKRQKAQFEIIMVERLNCSCYGNPNYKLVLWNEDGDRYVAKTASNAMIGYECHYGWEGTKKTFTYHFTKNGNMILDYVEQ